MSSVVEDRCCFGAGTDPDCPVTASRGAEIGSGGERRCVAVFLTSVGLFAAALLVQVVWWRVRLPQRQTAVLLRLYLGWLASAVVVALASGRGGAIGLADGWDYLHLLVFYVPMTLGYICFYSSIESDSPSMLMIRWTAAGGAAGRAVASYRRVINEDMLVGNRIGAMLRDGLAVNPNGPLVLTPAGRRLARLFALSFRILGLRDGG